MKVSAFPATNKLHLVITEPPVDVLQKYVCFFFRHAVLEPVSVHSLEPFIDMQCYALHTEKRLRHAYIQYT